MSSTAASDEVEPGSLRGRCGTRGHAQLGADVRDVPVHGVLAEHESRRDLLVTQPLGHEPKHLGLSPGQRRLRSIGPTAVAKLGQEEIGPLGFSLRSQLPEGVARGAHLVRGSLLATEGGERDRKAETGAPCFIRGSTSLEAVDGILERQACALVFAAGGREQALGEVDAEAG
jgi:hypothetical protein